MLDRRHSLRRKTYLGGRVVFNHRQSTMDCLVRNMGEQGARLAFTHPATVPHEFDLQVPRMGATFRVRIAWWGADELGVAFTTRETDNVIPLDMALRMRKLEAEKSRLTHRLAELGAGEWS